MTDQVAAQKRKGEITEQVCGIVSEQFGVPLDKVVPESNFVNDLGCDSLDAVELIMEVEDAFDISIPDDDGEKMQTVGLVVDYLLEHGV